MNLGSSENPQLVPVRHMQAVAHGSEDVEIPLSLLFNLGTGVVVIASVVYFSPEALLTQKL